MTEPAVPAWPQPAALPPAPLPPATRPQALPAPTRPNPPQPRPAPTYPPPSYPPLAYEQRPPDQRSFESLRPYQPQVPPPGPPGGPPGDPPRQPPRRHDGRRSGSPQALWVILLLLLVGGGAAGVLIAHPFGHHPALRPTASGGSKSAGPAPAASGGAGPASPVTSTASPSAAAVTEQQAAQSVATMLSKSVSDRASIKHAADQVGNCGPGLGAAPKVFDDAATSRKSLLASLTAMPGSSALPPALVSDLTQAWQASIAADQAYAQWASDEITRGCSAASAPGDPGYQATITPDANATKYKTAFVAQWNPVAAKYGLTQYQQDQL